MLSGLCASSLHMWLKSLPLFCIQDLSPCNILGISHQGHREQLCQLLPSKGTNQSTNTSCWERLTTRGWKGPGGSWQQWAGLGIFLHGGCGVTDVWKQSVQNKGVSLKTMSWGVEGVISWADLTSKIHRCRWISTLWVQSHGWERLHGLQH